MIRFLRGTLWPVGSIGLFLLMVAGAPADSVTFTDSWKDSAKTSTLSRVDTGSFSISLTVPGLSGLSQNQLTSLVVSASFGDISLPGSFSSNPKVSVSGLTSSQTWTNGSGQVFTVGSESANMKGNVVTIKGSVSNPAGAPPYPIFADQFLGSNGPIVAQRLLTVSVTGPLTYNLQKTIYITGKGSVTPDPPATNLYSVQVSGAVNFTPPTLTFINPGSHQQLTNVTQTAFVMVKDAGMVTNVQFSLNGGDFQAGSQLSSNIWTSAALTLTPGTNIISAYAVDADGYFSTTNTVSVVYVVLAPVTVNIVGGGSLKPNDNNMSLAIGRSFTMKATPAKGFGFQFWSVAANGVTNMFNNASLTFIMTNELVITANFVDDEAPTLKISSPKSNAKETNGTVTVSGTASDNVGVTAVGVQVNSNGWVMAEGSTTWSATLPVSNGANTIQAYAMDAAGNISKTNTVKFTGVLPPDWAPDSLANSTVLVTPDAGNAISASFSETNFSQTDLTMTGDSGVGSYQYSKIFTNFADLQLAFDLPPGMSSSTAEDIQLTFTNVNEGRFTNEAATGSFSVVAQSTFLPSSLSGHTVTVTDTADNILQLKFTSKTAVTVSLLGQSVAGSYVLTAASPVGAMLALTIQGSPDVAYLQLTFSSKSAGHFEVNGLDGGVLPSTDSGTFTFK